MQIVQILSAELKNELSQNGHPHVVNNPKKKQITIRTFMASLSHFPSLVPNYHYHDFQWQRLVLPVLRLNINTVYILLYLTYFKWQLTFTKPLLNARHYLYGSTTVQRHSDPLRWSLIVILSFYRKRHWIIETECRFHEGKWKDVTDLKRGICFGVES